MSHYGLLCPPYLGHLNPMLALAEELRRRGHVTTYFGLAEAAPVVEASGARAVSLGATFFPPGSLSRLKHNMASPRGLGLFRIIADMARMTDTLCEEAPAALAAAGVDALLVDQLEPAGGLLSGRMRLPFVSISNALPIDREPSVPPPFTDWAFDPSPRGVRRNIGGYRVADAMMIGMHRVIRSWGRRWDLPYRSVDDCLSHEAEVSQLVPSLDFPRHGLPATFHYCGPFRRREDVSDLGWLLGSGGRPLVFASLGTLQGGRLDLFTRIAQACARLGVQLVVAHGGALTPAQAATLPGSPIVRSFVPQRALLDHGAAAVTNGGLNTVLDALAAGVPLVTIPIAFEQGAIGARLRASGAGLTVPLRRAQIESIEAALTRLLTDTRFRLSAERIGGEIARSGGVAAAADVIESRVSSKADNGQRRWSA